MLIGSTPATAVVLVAASVAIGVVVDPCSAVVVAVAVVVVVGAGELADSVVAAALPSSNLRFFLAEEGASSLTTFIGVVPNEAVLSFSAEDALARLRFFGRFPVV